MANDFIIFLVGGLIALGVLLAFFGSSEISSTVNVPTGNKYIANMSGLITIGPKNIDTFKTYAMGDFRTSYILSEKTYTVQPTDIYNGVLFGSNTIKYSLYAKGIENLKIHFRIDRTNDYGPLTIKLNGIIVAQRVYPVGEYDVLVPTNFLSENMIIDIESVSSGWKFWAPTFYALSDVRFIPTAFALDYTEFKFNARDAFDTFQSGTVDLSFAKYTGSLVLEMNGKVLYSNPVQRVQSVRFQKTDLVKGDNSLLIKSDMGSDFIGTARVNVFYTKTEEDVLRIPLTLTPSQYSSLVSGRIIFSIVNIASPGGVNTRIEPENSFNDYQTVKEKTITMTFDKKDVIQGENIIVIRSEGNAVFDITKPMITI